MWWEPAAVQQTELSRHAQGSTTQPSANWQDVKDVDLDGARSGLGPRTAAMSTPRASSVLPRSEQVVHKGVG
jgi:hypothetical protein